MYYSENTYSMIYAFCKPHGITFLLWYTNTNQTNLNIIMLDSVIDT